MLGTFILLVLLAVYFGLGVCAYKVTGLWRELCAFSKKDIVICFLVSGIILAVVYGIIAGEEFAYYWDFSGYWYMALQRGTAMLADPIGGLEWLYISICADEYNGWIPLLIALPLKLLGGSYVSYLLVRMVLFILPTILTCTLLVKRLLSCCNFKITLPAWGYFSLFCGAVPFIRPTLDGYADAACLFYVALLLTMGITSDFRRFSVKHSLLIAAIILHLSLMRRAYCFFIIAFAICLLFRMVVDLIYVEKTKRHLCAMEYAKNLLLIGGICISVLLLVFPNYVLNIIKSNMFVSYSAWGKMRSQGKYINFLGEYGIYVLLFSVFGICAFLKGGSPDKRRTAAVLGGSTVLLILYNLVLGDGFTIHGYYTISVQLLALTVLGMTALLNILSHVNARKCLCTGFALLHIVNFAIGVGFQSPGPLCILQNAQFVRRMRSDMDQLRLLEVVLGQYSAGVKPVYILSSSSILNDDIIRNLRLPKFNPQLNLFYTYHVDLREGFPTHFFDAEIIVVATPLQTHLLPEDQKIIGALFEFMESEAALEFFAPYPDEFKLDNGVHVSIYHKIKELDRETVLEFATQFHEYYPEFDALFYNRINDYANSR